MNTDQAVPACCGHPQCVTKQDGFCIAAQQGSETHVCGCRAGHARWKAKHDREIAEGHRAPLALRIRSAEQISELEWPEGWL